WRGQVADKDDFIEMLEATKPISSIKVLIVETVKASKAQAEFIIGTRYNGMRRIEPGIGARCIGIRAIECGVLPCPLICAVAGAAIKTHAITQPRRTDFLQFIALQVSRN